MKLMVGRGPEACSISTTAPPAVVAVASDGDRRYQFLQRRNRTQTDDIDSPLSKQPGASDGD